MIVVRCGWSVLEADFWGLRRAQSARKAGRSLHARIIGGGFPASWLAGAPKALKRVEVPSSPHETYASSP